MSSQYEYDKLPTVARDDSAAVLMNLWRAPDRPRREAFTQALIDAVWPTGSETEKLVEGELSFALFDDGDRNLLGYKQWTSKAVYDAYLEQRGFGGAAAFEAEHSDVAFWHDWFAVYPCEGTTERLHLGLRGDTGLCVAAESDAWFLRPFDQVPLSGRTRFRLLRGIQRRITPVTI